MSFDNCHDFQIFKKDLIRSLNRIADELHKANKIASEEAARSEKKLSIALLDAKAKLGLATVGNFAEVLNLNAEEIDTLNKLALEAKQRSMEVNERK